MKTARRILGTLFLLIFVLPCAVVFDILTLIGQAGNSAVELVSEMASDFMK